MHAAVSRTHAAAYGLPFYLTLAYLALEYARPQETIPGLASLRLPAVITTLLAVALLTSASLRLEDAQTKLFIALLALMTFHVPFAVNNFWAFQSTKAMLITFIAYLAVITFIDSPQKFHVLITVWLGIHTYLALTGIAKGGKGVGGFLGDENDFALVLNMAIPFSFFLALQAEGLIARLLYIIITVVLIACSTATFSRGGFIGLMVVGIHFWFRSPRKAISTVVVALTVIAMLYLLPESYWKDMQTIADEPNNPVGTGQERVYSWRIAWTMFLDHPFLGVGPENFPWNFESYEVAGGFNERLHGGRAAHSLYFTLIPELGIVGVFLFVHMLYTSLRDIKISRGRTKSTFPPSSVENVGMSKEKRRCHGLAFEGSLLAYLVSGTFISVLYYPSFWIWMAMVIAFKRTAPSST
jgi:probable O-glycosylation ligase (exosortase A-associated)